MFKRISLVVTLLLIFGIFAPAAVLGNEAPQKDFNSTERLDAQWDAEQRILSEYRQGSYSEQNPYVVQDPYGWSPLTALVMFDTKTPSEVSITVKGKDARSTLSNVFKGFKTHHEIPVYGLYAASANQVTLNVKYQDGRTYTKTLTITTGALPEKFPNVDVKTVDPSKYADGFTFMVGQSNNDINKPFAVDINGDVRWYLSGGEQLGEVGPIRKMSDGKILLFSDKLERQPYYKASFYLLDLTGKVHKEYVRNGLHHDVIELPNGNYLAVTEEYGAKTTEDVVVELDGKTGEVVRTLDFKEIYHVDPLVGNDSFLRGNTLVGLLQKPDATFNQMQEKARQGLAHDWLHINAVHYIPAEDSILVSARHQNAVFKVNLKTREIVWIITDHKGNDWPEDMKSKLLTPVGQPFDWQYGQHAVTMLPNGDIFLYDNGNYAGKTADISAAKDCYSRGVIYRVDEKNMTVKQVWQYGKERGGELYTPYIGDVDYLGPNHYLINFGGIINGLNGIYRYHSPRLTGKAGIAGGIARIVEVRDNKVVYEIETNGVACASIYRDRKSVV